MPAQSEYDVVVVGSGVAGLATALTAAKLGLKAIVLEKGAQFGGATSVSHGCFWMGANHLAAAAGYSDSRAETLSYMEFIGGGQIDLEKTRTFVERADGVLRFYEECGIQFTITRSLPDHYYPAGPGSKKSGRTLETALISADELGELRDSVFLPPHEAPEATSQEAIEWGGMSNLAGWNSELIKSRRVRRMRGRGCGFIVHFLKAKLNKPVKEPTRVDDGSISSQYVVERRFFRPIGPVREPVGPVAALMGAPVPSALIG